MFWMHQMAAVHAVMPDADIDAVRRAYPRLLDKNLDMKLIVAYEPTDATAPGATHPPSDAPDRAVSRRSA